MCVRHFLGHQSTPRDFSVYANCKHVLSPAKFSDSAQRPNYTHNRSGVPSRRVVCLSLSHSLSPETLRTLRCVCRPRTRESWKVNYLLFAILTHDRIPRTRKHKHSHQHTSTHSHTGNNGLRQQQLNTTFTSSKRAQISGFTAVHTQTTHMSVFRRAHRISVSVSQ